MSRACEPWCDDPTADERGHECSFYRDDWQVLATGDRRAFGDGNGYLGDGGRVPHASILLGANTRGLDHLAEGPMLCLSISDGNQQKEGWFTIREGRMLVKVLTDAINVAEKPCSVSGNRR